MRKLSGLHVLSAVVLRDFGAPVTGGYMEPLIARMDFDLSDVPETSGSMLSMIATRRCA
jgi:misacylated tRNA(Ala) deacylase